MIYVNFTRLTSGRVRVSAWGGWLNGQPEPPFTIEPAMPDDWPPQVSIDASELVTVRSGEQYAVIAYRDSRPVVIEGELNDLELFSNGLPLEDK